MPSWDEVQAASDACPWLTVTPLFTGHGDRLDPATISEVLHAADADSTWFPCGPTALKDDVLRELRVEGIA